MASIEQIKNGIATFIESEFFPAMSGKQLWAAAFALGVARSQADVILNTVLQNKYIAMSGIVDNAGNINTDAAIEAAKYTARKYGKFEIDIPMIGKFAIGEAGFDKLDEYIKSSERKQ